MPPFFFLCNYHGKPQQSNLDSGEVAISVSIAGNPENYRPEGLYEVTIMSTRDFDGFMLTGLYTIKSKLQSRLSLLPQTTSLPSLGIGSEEPLGQKATATLGDQVLFKDTTVMQLCEEGGG
ncbi:hypothetical protein NP493_626g01001 [Ridgeia piscesae]|uniref:Uncharacterized protein n=1 Tax=Ridgeia piscesae TaxID=27915 RepID=A0AAD9KT55_RIDPI|nr:hypothetical protein NP493_626g01001 [Ridgeia piscesae]